MDGRERNRDERERQEREREMRKERERERQGRKRKNYKQKDSRNFILSCFSPQNGVKHDNPLLQWIVVRQVSCYNPLSCFNPVTGYRIY